MRPMIFAVFAALMVQPVQAATMTLSQTIEGSYDNRFTRTNSETFGLFDGVKEVQLKNGYEFTDTTAPSGSFARFDSSLGTLERVRFTYERVGGLDDRVLLRGSGCTTTLGDNCTREVLVSAALGYGFETSLPGGFGSQRGSNIGTQDTPVPLRSFISFVRPRTFSTHVITPSDLEQFIGAGTFEATPTFSLVLNHYTNCDVVGFDDLRSCDSEVRLQYSADYRITMEYIYDAVTPPPPPPAVIPLPAGAPLLLAGLGALTLLRRRAARR